MVHLLPGRDGGGRSVGQGAGGGGGAHARARRVSVPGHIMDFLGQDGKVLGQVLTQPAGRRTEGQTSARSLLEIKVNISPSESLLCDFGAVCGPVLVGVHFVLVLVLRLQGDRLGPGGACTVASRSLSG